MMLLAILFFLSISEDDCNVLDDTDDIGDDEDDDAVDDVDDDICIDCLS